MHEAEPCGCMLNAWNAKWAGTVESWIDCIPNCYAHTLSNDNFTVMCKSCYLVNSVCMGWDNVQLDTVPSIYTLGSLQISCRSVLIE